MKQLEPNTINAQKRTRHAPRVLLITSKIALFQPQTSFHFSPLCDRSIHVRWWRVERGEPSDDVTD
jgi:hypothetical protein